MKIAHDHDRQTLKIKDDSEEANTSNKNNKQNKDIDIIVFDIKSLHLNYFVQSLTLVMYELKKQ